MTQQAVRFLDGATSEECRTLDRRATADFAIPGLLLMEHASIGAARLACNLLDERGPRVSEARVGVVCGPGNNGGDGYGVARHLHQAGARVTIWELTRPAHDAPETDAGRNALMAAALGLERHDASSEWPSAGVADDFDLLIDAVFGTGLSRAPAHRFAEAITWLNGGRAPVLALDVPSGLDGDTGRAVGAAAVEAQWTVTFGLLKRGLLLEAAARFTGQLFCVPIGAPRQLLPMGAPSFPPGPFPIVARR